MTTRVLLRCTGPIAVAIKRPQNRPYAAPELLAVLKPDEEQEFAVAGLNDLLIEEVDQGVGFP